MFIFINVLILLFEVLYYSLYMKFTKSGNLLRYILLFIINTLIIMFLNSSKLYVYLVFILTSFIGLKYIIRTKTSLYDMFVIVLMLFIKLFIEIVVISILSLFIKNAYILSIIASIIKIALIVIGRNKLKCYYQSLKVRWDNNNFGIRYLFTIAMFLYTIISCMFLVF